LTEKRITELSVENRDTSYARKQDLGLLTYGENSGTNRHSPIGLTLALPLGDPGYTVSLLLCKTEIRTELPE
jgi:hypothetical protein